MRRFFILGILALFMVSVPGLAFGWSIWGNETFRGKLIDADTYEPIEGAVVVMVWNKSWPGLGAGAMSKFMMAKEVMTDANGEWSIRGPRGKGSYDLGPIMTILSLITYIHIVQPPTMIFFKPGYCRQGQKYGGLGASPYIDKKNGMVGIVLYRFGDTDKEEREFMEILKMHAGEMPFIPVDDPIEKLRTLDFPLEYTEDYIWIKKKKRLPFYLVGLKKAETLDERKRAYMTPASIELWVDLPLLREMSEQEWNFLFNKRRSMK